MAASKLQSWWDVKAKIIRRWGGITQAANALGCSPEAIRYSAKGKCPRVKARLEAQIGKY
jgi:hypothetical protein